MMLSISHTCIHIEAPLIDMVLRFRSHLRILSLKVWKADGLCLPYDVLSINTRKSVGYGSTQITRPLAVLTLIIIIYRFRLYILSIPSDPYLSCVKTMKVGSGIMPSKTILRYTYNGSVLIIRIKVNIWIKTD